MIGAPCGPPTGNIPVRAARSPVGKRYCEMRRISEASFEKHGRRSLMVLA